jgi:hypothetical protein
MFRSRLQPKLASDDIRKEECTLTRLPHNKICGQRDDLYGALECQTTFVVSPKCSTVEPPPHVLYFPNLCSNHSSTANHS